MGSLSEFRALEKSCTAPLPDEVAQILASLAEQLGLNVQPTKRGVALLGLMNKLSAETYREVATQIDIVLRESDYDAFFKVVTSNMFYAELYATLCTYLLNHHPTLRTYVMQQTSAYKISALTDTQRSTTAFFTHLSLKGFIPPDMAAQLANIIVGHMTRNLKDEEYKEQIAEWTEHLFVIVNAKPALHKALQKQLDETSKFTVKTHAGLTNKTIFRLEDILDKFK
jgi:hypothetical protein